MRTKQFFLRGSVIITATAFFAPLWACVPEENDLLQAGSNGAVSTSSGITPESNPHAGEPDGQAATSSTGEPAQEVLGFQPAPPPGPNATAEAASAGDANDTTDTTEATDTTDTTDDGVSQAQADTAPSQTPSQAPSQEPTAPADETTTDDPQEPAPFDPSLSPEDPPAWPPPARAVGLSPVTHDAAGYLDAVDKASQCAEAALVQVTFAWDFLQGWTDGPSYRARYDWLVHVDPNDGHTTLSRKGLGSAFWLSFTNPADTTEIASPWGPEATTFTDPTVADAYIAECAWFAAYARPDYLALGVEVDAYLAAASQAERDAFLDAWQRAYDACKVACPDCTVFVYFQYENVRANNLWEMIEPFARVGDVYGVSSYPSLPLWGDDTGYTADTLPADYYDDITFRLGVDRPIVIAEAGHPASGSKYFTSSSPSRQAAMIDRIFDRLADCEVDLLAWTYLYDADLSAVYDNDTATYFGSFGLLHPDQPSVMTAWDAWIAH